MVYFNTVSMESPYAMADLVPVPDATYKWWTVYVRQQSMETPAVFYFIVSKFPRSNSRNENGATSDSLSIRGRESVTGLRPDQSTWQEWWNCQIQKKNWVRYYRARGIYEYQIDSKQVGAIQPIEVVLGGSHLNKIWIKSG